MKLHHIGIVSNNIRDAIKRHKTIFGLKQVISIVKDPCSSDDDSPVLNILKKGISPPISLQSLYFLFYSALHIYAFKR